MLVDGDKVQTVEPTVQKLSLFAPEQHAWAVNLLLGDFELTRTRLSKGHQCTRDIASRR